MSPDLRRVIHSLQPEKICFGEGEIIFQVGEKPNNLIMIEKGSVSLVGESEEECADCRERKIWGLKEILTGSQFRFNLVACGDLHCLRIDSQHILAKSQTDPSFRITLMEQLAFDMLFHPQGYE